MPPQPAQRGISISTSTELGGIACKVESLASVLEGVPVRSVITTRRAPVKRLARRLTGLLPAASPEARGPAALRVGTAGRDAPAVGAAILPLHLNYGPNQHALSGQQR